MSSPPLHVALIHPEIGPNTGNIGRLCLGIGARLHLIHPLGFSTSDKAVRRAGLDYWKHVDCVEHADLETFLSWLTADPQRRFHLLSTKGTTPYTTAAYTRGDVLLFGAESKGLPADLIAAHGALRIPMPGPVRSLNLANAAAIITMTALQQISPELFT
ncbi:MAG: tRNA (cytidine(34)-2'-O)-methyltransferase [Myxococcota bacterium]|nr:tRNA (cytidine(34)-2'-O)-methyltransferase [Myxococcota bacterium]